MTREEKNQYIVDLANELNEYPVIYIADIGGLNAEQTSKLRRLCSQKSVKLKVVKNTLLEKAMERLEDKNFGKLPTVLKGESSILLSDTGNVPARLIKSFRAKQAKPLFKGAYVEEAIFIGDEQLEVLENLKSKNELVADVIALLQSPIKNVVGALESGKTTLAGLVKTLEERN
jgi:large subunit ribosomal protein L10